MLIPTRISYLVALALIATGSGWIVATIWPTFFGSTFSVPPLTAVTMWFVAAALFIWTVLARKKIKPTSGLGLDPLLAARSAALAMSASRVGSLALGFYLGVLIDNVVFSHSVASKDRVVTCAITATASFMTVAIGLWLEHICRLPKPPAPDTPTS